MGIVPGEDPGPRGEPLLADEPRPPGVEDYSEDVDALERRLRERGPAEVEDADRQADAVEGGDGTGSGARADSDRDPTSDEGADPEDPEAQHGEGPSQPDAD